LKSWKPVKRYKNDPDPQNPHEFDTEFCGFYAVLAFELNGQWSVSCKELNLKREYVGRSFQEALTLSAEKLMRARENLQKKLDSQAG
jgi:hypothetical protein